MFLFYLINLIHGESDFISSIRNQLSMNQNDAAFQAANSKILEKSSNDVDNTLFFLRGYASVKMLNFDQGISDLSRFLSDINNVSPKDKTDAYSLRATAYLKTGQLEEAQKDAQEIHENAIIQEVKNARTWLTYANLKKDNPIFTLKCYVKLIGICPFSEKFIQNLTIMALKKDNITYITEMITKGKSELPEEARIMIKLLYSFLTVDRAYIYELNTPTKSTICKHLQQKIKDYRSNLIKAQNCLHSKDFNCANNHFDNCIQILTELSSENTTQYDALTKIINSIINRNSFYKFSKIMRSINLLDDSLELNIEDNDKTDCSYEDQIEDIEELIDPNPYSDFLYFFKSDSKIYDVRIKFQKNKLNELYKKLKNIEKQKDSYSEEDFNKLITDITDDIQKNEEKMTLYSNKNYDPLYAMFGLTKEAKISDLEKVYKNISKNHNINKKEMEQIDIAYEFLSACKEEWDDFSNKFLSIEKSSFIFSSIKNMGEIENLKLMKTKNLFKINIEIMKNSLRVGYKIDHTIFSNKCQQNDFSVSYHSDFSVSYHSDFSVS